MSLDQCKLKEVLEQNGFVPDCGQPGYCASHGRNWRAAQAEAPKKAALQLYLIFLILGHF
jgi:hypothetical protein